ncbi:hypothetical protein [Phormidesmis priestleyi]|uniref:hypothetical protein n=1 Tax=Phormidesmis priestleyi TaxID=268141 RepID=UPI00083A8B85|nr:hypothetical protein [Phormidesmis priestleyi]
MEHEWLSFDLAMKVQTWLVDGIHAEQKLSCQVHLKVIKACITSKDFPPHPGLEYVQDLRALYAEGRYEAMLIQLYQLDISVATLVRTGCRGGTFEQ